MVPRHRQEHGVARAERVQLLPQAPEHLGLHSSELLRLAGLDEVPGEEDRLPGRSEEHTSELQSLRHLVCRLLLEKKKRARRAAVAAEIAANCFWTAAEFAADTAAMLFWQAG